MRVYVGQRLGLPSCISLYKQFIDNSLDPKTNNQDKEESNRAAVIKQAVKFYALESGLDFNEIHSRNHIDGVKQVDYDRPPPQTAKHLAALFRSPPLCPPTSQSSNYLNKNCFQSFGEPHKYLNK